MTDRVKNLCFFDTLYSNGMDPSGLRVLDLFSGTGSLALEALSRGAKEVHIVESHRQAIRIIRKKLSIVKN